MAAEQVVVAADGRQRRPGGIGKLGRKRHRRGRLAHQHMRRLHQIVRHLHRKHAARRQQSQQPRPAAPDAPAATGTRHWRRSRRPARPASNWPHRPVRTSTPGSRCRALAIMSGEVSKPLTLACGQRATSSSVELPGPQPMSTTRRGFSSGICASRSRAGRVRSSSNLRYCAADQSGVLAPEQEQSSSIDLAAVADSHDIDSNGLVDQTCDDTIVADAILPVAG